MDGFSILMNVLAVLSSAASSLTKVKELLPQDGSGKNELASALEDLERAKQGLKRAEIEFAHGLGFQICHNHFPPGIMLSENDEDWTCPECGNTRDIGAHLGVGPSPLADYRG